MSWDRWWQHEWNSPAFEKAREEGRIIVAWDLGKEPPVVATPPEPKREYTVARSTRAMPERRKL